MNRVFLGFSILIMISLSFFLYSCSYSSKAAEKLLDKAKTTSYDIIVVPGVPFNTPQWDKVMRGRVYWSKYLYDQGIAKNIMYSGSSVYSPYYEGEIMAMYAEAIGIPKEHIFTESKAEHSTENIYYSYKKARKLGFVSVALASDHFQTKSLKKFTKKKISPDVGMIPWVMSIIKEMDPTMINPEIDHQKAFNPDFISIKKRQGFFKRLKGTWGKNLDANLYD
jgi:uncharacterized SAM-binding protein YcdF (DUF218 family)